MNLQTLRTFTTKIIFSKTPPRTLQRSREKKLSLKIIFQLSKSSNYPIKSSSKNPQNLIQNKKREITFQKNNSSKSLSQYLPRESLNYPKIVQSLKWSVSIVQVRKRDYCCIPFLEDDSSSQILDISKVGSGVYRFAVTASGEQPHRNQTCGVIHRLRAIATAWLVPPLRSSIIAAVHLSSTRPSWDCVTMERKRWMKQP